MMFLRLRSVVLFRMDWGHLSLKSLGPHYTIFYSPDFINELVNVTLCAKTHGWMGIGWLSPSHSGLLMNHTDPWLHSSMKLRGTKKSGVQDWKPQIMRCSNGFSGSRPSTTGQT